MQKFKSNITLKGTDFKIPISLSRYLTPNFRYSIIIIITCTFILFLPSSTKLKAAVERSVDRTPPIGTISINNGATSTSIKSVVLSSKVTDVGSGVYGMTISMDGKKWNRPIAYNPKLPVLLPREGNITVYAMFGDRAGNWSRPVSDTIVVDLTPPVMLKIEDLDSQMARGDVNFTRNTNLLAARWTSTRPETVIQSQYSVGTAPLRTDVIPWTSVNQTSMKRLGLHLMNGKTYYCSVKVRNQAGSWSKAISSDGITIDNTNPSGAITINNNSTTTSSNSVSITFSGADRISGIKSAVLSNEGSGIYTPVSLAGNLQQLSWKLTSRIGIKIVSLQIWDKAGNYYKTFDSINVVMPQVEICDGKDNDADGKIDEFGEGEGNLCLNYPMGSICKQGRCVSYPQEEWICKDTDSGKNYYEQGGANVFYGNGNHGLIDVCKDGVLTEIFCNSYNWVQSESIECPEGCDGDYKCKKPINPNLGAQKTLVVLTDIAQASPNLKITIDQVHSLIFEKLNNFVKTNSYGRSFLEGDVVGPYVIQEDLCNYNVREISDKILRFSALKASENISLEQYKNIIIFSTDNRPCFDRNYLGPSGIPNLHYNINGKDIVLDTVLLFDDYVTGDALLNTPWLIPHEFSHSLFLAHYDGLLCFDEQGSRISIGSNCSYIPLLPAHDVMGGPGTYNLPRGAENLSLPNRYFVGWLKKENIVITNEGLYNIEDTEIKSNNIKLIKIPAPNRSVEYLIEYTSLKPDGVMLYASTPGQHFLRFLDAAPFPITNQFQISYYPMFPGEMYTDEQAGISIRLLNINSNSTATVEISKFTSLTQCNDGVNNDSAIDSNINFDEKDFSCYENGVYNPQHISEFDPIAECQDGFDNDFDGKIDLEDPQCNDSSDNLEST
jgi:hypothetical protein